MKRSRPIVFACAVIFKLTLMASVVFAQSVEFSEPWKNPQIALALDPYEGNEIDWEQLATDTRVVAIIHRATIGNRADRKYAERRDEAKKRGYKWGAYHLGKPGDPLKQADFFLETVKPLVSDLIALDLESTDKTRDMSFAEARVFIKRIKEKTGRYPLVYANHKMTRAISDQYGSDEVFSKTRLWYARFKKDVTDFPSGTWKTYTVWQFSSELNCSGVDRAACLYTVPGTEYDMAVDVYNGTIEELISKWPLRSDNLFAISRGFCSRRTQLLPKSESLHFAGGSVRQLVHEDVSAGLLETWQGGASERSQIGFKVVTVYSCLRSYYKSAGAWQAIVIEVFNYGDATNAFVPQQHSLNFYRRNPLAA